MVGEPEGPKGPKDLKGPSGSPTKGPGETTYQERFEKRPKTKHAGVRVCYPLTVLGFAPCDIGLAEPGSAVSGLSLGHSPLQNVFGIYARSRKGLRRANDDRLFVAPMRKQLALSTAPRSPPRNPG